MDTNEIVTKIAKIVRNNIKSFTMIIALLIIWLFFTVLTQGVFLKAQNLSNLFRQMTLISFLALGMVLVIVTNNIDLSVGSVVGFISAIAAALQAYILPDILPNMFPALSIFQLSLLSTIITIVISIIVGLLIGVFQGVLIAYLGIPAFIITLGGMLIFRGGCLGITQGKTIVPIESTLVYIAQGYQSKVTGLSIAFIVILIIFASAIWSRKQKATYGFKLKPLYIDLLTAAFFSFLVLVYVIYVANGYRGFQNPVLLLAIISVIFSYISTNTRFGRYCYALGGNMEATRLSGVNIKKNIFIVFILMGVLCAIAGIVLTGYVAAGTIGGGKDYELTTIASCIIGGTSFAGGIGTVFGAIVGSLVMASLENGMSVMNMDVFWQYIVKGLVLIAAVYIDVASKKKA